MKRRPSGSLSLSKAIVEYVNYKLGGALFDT